MKIGKVKKLMALLLILVLAVSVIGCSKNGKKEDSTTTNSAQKGNDDQQGNGSDAVGVNNTSDQKVGYYQEDEIDISNEEDGEWVTDITTNVDGEVEYSTCSSYGKSKIYNYLIKDGKTEKRPVEWANKAIEKEGGQVMQFEMGADGNYFLLLQDYQTLDKKIDDQNVVYIISRIYENSDDDKEYVEITPKTWNDKEKGILGSLTGTQVNNVKITQDGTIVYINQSDMSMGGYSIKEEKEVDLSAVNKNTNPQDYLQCPCVLGNCIYYYSSGESSIHTYDLTTKSESSIDSEFVLMNGCVSVSQNGDIYYADEKGIHRYAINGTMWETIVTADNKLMGSPMNRAGMMCMKEGGENEFYLVLNSTTAAPKHNITRVWYCNEPIPEITDRLSVYSLRENNTIRDAIVKYQSENPNIQIDYHVAMPVPGEVSISDEIRSLNTELLAGKGADILILDGLPLNSYIKNGTLLDLSDILSPMVNDKTLLSNIAGSYSKDDKIYAMPVRFVLPYYVTLDTSANQLGSMKDIAGIDSSLEKPFLPYGNYEQMFRLFVKTYYDDFISDQSNIDETKFGEFLEQAKDVINKIPISDKVTLERYLSNGIDYVRSMKRYIYLDSSLSQISSNSYASTGYADDFTDLNSPLAVKKRLKAGITTMDSTFIPSGVVGINGSSKSQEAAKDFLKFLFSEKMQNNRNLDGFPVNANSLETWCNIEPAPSEDIMFGDDKVTVEIYGATVEEKHQLKSLMEEVSKPTFDNEAVFDMIMEQSLDYITGGKALDDAVKDTVSKVNIYLSEQ